MTTDTINATFNATFTYKNREFEIRVTYSPKALDDDEEGYTGEISEWGRFMSQTGYSYRELFDWEWDGSYYLTVAEAMKQSVDYIVSTVDDEEV